MIDVHARQIPDLFHGEFKPDTVIECHNAGDGDGPILAAEEMALLKQDMGHVVIPGVDHQPLNFSEFTVGCVDVITSPNTNFARRKAVVCDHLATVPRIGMPWALCLVAQGEAAILREAKAIVGLTEHLIRAVAGISDVDRQELGLFSGLQVVEFSQRAPYPNLVALGLIGQAMDAQSS